MSILIKDLVSKNQSNVIFLQSSDTAAYALKAFDKYNITSAPILGSDGKIWGFLDVVDIVIFLTNKTSKQSNLTSEELCKIAERSAEFNLGQIADVLNISQRNSYFPLNADQTLKEAVEIFRRGPHRIAITSHSNNIVNILTQTNIISWFAKDITRMGLKAEYQAKNFMQPIVFVYPETLTIEAFKLMADKGLSSVAVIENDTNNQSLVGTLSATDLKNINDLKFMRLFLPVSEFLASVRKEQGRPLNYQVKCFDDTPLKEVVKKLVHEHVHRIFVIDHRQQAVGVISIFDIIKGVFP